jgi:PAS domain S-box-containing protein
LCIRALRQDGLTVSADVARTREEFCALLASKTYDVILADCTLPGWSGMDALKHLQQERSEIPLILITGTLDEEAAIGCIRAGASDCVLKGGVARLVVAVRRAVKEKSLSEGRLRAEQALMASEERYRMLFERNLAGVYRTTPDGRILDLNEACARMFGYASRQEAMAHTLWDVSPSVAEMQMLITLVQKQKTFTRLEVCLRRIDGRPVWVLAGASLIEDEQGKPASIEGTLIDITERKRLEEQLRQSAKMEAVGRLAGGVAHDFNNLLTAVLGYSDLLLERLPAASPLWRYAAEVKKAGERASSLTRQLLAFSRQQVLAPQVLNLNTVVADMHEMLRRLIGGDIELVTSLEPQLGNVKADPGQIEQSILNLAVNARDAMPEGGTLKIETANIELNDGVDVLIFEQPGVRRGKYVMLAVNDSGRGMDAETQTLIFEPFFTTKGRDKGTGLGLSTVYGIVKQSEGYIAVQSEPGQGATFKVYLPRVEQEEVKPRETLSALGQGSETVLLVEEEEGVRELARLVLLAKGYTLLEAVSAEEALRISASHDGPIALVLTDVILPHLSGPELAQRLATLRPETKVLYLSGYTGGAMGRPEISESRRPEQPVRAMSGSAFLQKPFTSVVLARKVREVLDAAEGWGLKVKG